MNVNAFRRVDSLDDPPGLDAVAAALREWEPSLELCRPPRDALLYEPDGTLYAVCLADELTLRTDRRTVTVHKGDALVVPQAFALDAGPDVDLLAFRHDGPPPDHFRERFIQVWGFEALSAPAFTPSRAGLAEVIPSADARYRVPYAIVDVNETEDDVSLVSGDPLVVFGLGGEVTLSFGRPGALLSRRLVDRVMAVVSPSTPCRVRGAGRVGVLTVLNELAHQSRRTGPPGTRGPFDSPEYRPPSRA